RTVGRSAQTDIGASLDLDALLIPDPGLTADSAPQRVVAQVEVPAAVAAPSTSDSANQSGGFRPVHAYGQAVAPIPRPDTRTEDQAEPDDEVIARRIARLAKAAGKDPRNGASAPALYDVQSGLQAFCRGAGIDTERLPADAQTRMMHLVGQLF